MAKLYKTYERGEKVGKIELLDVVYKLDNKRKRKYWRCKCLRCNKIFIAREDLIRLGQYQSCGCLRKHYYKLKYVIYA